MQGWPIPDGNGIEHQKEQNAKKKMQQTPNLNAGDTVSQH
jgi:hypothetical protein